MISAITAAQTSSFISDSSVQGQHRVQVHVLPSSLANTGYRKCEHLLSVWSNYVW
jgi:hypothetical protein